MSDNRVALVSSVALQAAAFDIKSHPNKMPFSGVLTYLDEPSDGAPEGTDGKRIIVTAQAAKDALDSLIGMGVDCQHNLGGHAPQHNIGVITDARIEAVNARQAIIVDGYIWAVNFPALAKEIKENKDALGMSFEARNLWTYDPKANPVSIVELVFTGAAILFKDKAAYKTTSINAAATADSLSQEDFQMTEESKKEFAALLAEALKPVADQIAAQGKEIEELKKLPENMAKVQAANVVDKVEPHAKRLDEAANKMEDAGIGLHANGGHVHILRKMANDMRADAAQGKMPHVFDRFLAAADKPGPRDDKAAADAVAAVKADGEKQLADVKAAAAKVEAEAKDKVASLETQVKDLTAKLAKVEASADTSKRPERVTLPFALNASQEKLLAKSGIEVPAEGKIDIAALNAALAKSTLSQPQRWELKTILAHMGKID